MDEWYLLVTVANRHITTKGFKTLDKAYERMVKELSEVTGLGGEIIENDNSGFSSQGEWLCLADKAKFTTGNHRVQMDWKIVKI